MKPLCIPILLASVVALCAAARADTDPDRGLLLDGVVAVVGGEVITRSELGEALAYRATLLKARQKAGLSKEEVDTQFRALQEEIRDNLVENRLILLAAREDGMSAEDEVRKRLEKLKAGLGNDPDKLKAYVAQQGFASVEEFESQMKDEYLRQRVVFTQVRPKAEVGAKDIEEAFKSRYAGSKAVEAGCQGAYVRVFSLEQARFQMPRDATVVTLIDTYAGAYGCYLDLKKGTFPLAEAETRCNAGGAAPGLGSLGDIDETKSFEKSFQQAFDSLVAAPEQRYSEPFMLNDGIWILHVASEHRECVADQAEIARLKERLGARLEDEKFERALSWWVKQLRGRYRVELIPLDAGR
jgi:hypothetical protein